jgi:hypothetical protein
MKINILEKFAQDYTTRPAGEKLRKMIIKAAENDKKIELDFSGLKIASASFFDESIGKLPDEPKGHDALKKVVVFHIHKLDYSLLEQICQTRDVETPAQGQKK